MNIEKYISELLYRHQCVVVPSFGGFLTDTASAQLVIGSNNFYPPKKLISFNVNLKNNDGLLANHVARGEKTDYIDAVHLIKNQVEIWNNLLETEHNITLNNIGSFSLNLDKNLVFVPQETFNYLATSFGLASFVSPDIKRENETKIIVTDREKTIDNNKIIPIIQFERQKKYANFKYAAVFLIGCGIASPVFLNLYKERQKINNLIVQANVQKIINSKIQEATFVINPFENVGTDKSIKNYHVVAGAFKIEANADKICKKLILKGFAAKKISKNINGLYPVIYASFYNYADARNAMTEIQKTNNTDAWVLIQEFQE